MEDLVLEKLMIGNYKFLLRESVLVTLVGWS